MGDGDCSGPDSCPDLRCSTCTGNPCASAPVAVAGIVGAIGITAFDYGTCALLSDGTVRCWGELSGTGIVGDAGNSCSSMSVLTPTPLPGLSEVGVLTPFCALLQDSTVECWGDNTWGQLANASTVASSTPVTVSALGGSVRMVDSRSEGACAIVADGSVRCWGYNGAGRVGDGTTSGPSTCTNGAGCATSPVPVVW